MENNFRIGDRVRVRESCWEGKGAGLWGYISGIPENGNGYYINFDNGAGDQLTKPDHYLKYLQFYPNELEPGFEAAVREAQCSNQE